MFYKTILWLVILVNFTPLNAQQNFTTFKVNFNVDEYVLDNADKSILGGLIAETKTSTYYEITLSAHTDNDGSIGYNMSLSNKRAQAVWDYLKINGVNDAVMDIDWYGEQRPEASNGNDEGKSINRRVEIVFKKFELNALGDILKASGGNYSQEFSINPNIDNTIQGKNGTRVFLPKGSLQTVDGKSISAENVTFELQEFPDSKDAIFNQLSTSSDGRILESGGMFTVKARYNGEELKLKKGQTLQIEMPSANIKKDMEVFVGVKNKQGITEWKATSKPFELKSNKKIEQPFVNLDVNYLKKLKQTSKLEEIPALSNSFKLPQLKAIPLVPKMPKLVAYPNENTYFNWFDKVFKSKKKRDRLYKKECENIDALNAEKKARYEKSLNAYKAEIKQLAIDSLAYINSQKEFRIWLKDQKEICGKRIREYEKIGFNHALNQLVEMSNANKIKTSFNTNILINNSTYTTEEMQDLNYLLLRENRIERLAAMTMDNIEKDYANHGLIDLDKELINDNGYNFYRISNNQFASEFVGTEPQLQSMFQKANDELLEKRDQLGLTDMNTLNAVYQANITEFGSINCDRFTNTPQAQMVNVKVECQKNVQISFFIPSMNSYLYADRMDEAGTYQVSLPGGTKATMVVVGLDHGAPVFEKQKYTVAKGLKITATPQKSTLKQIKQQVSNI